MSKALEVLKQAITVKQEFIGSMNNAIDFFYQKGLEIGKPAYWKDQPVLVVGFKSVFDANINALNNQVQVAYKYGNHSQAVESQQAYLYISLNTTWVSINDVTPYTSAAKVLYGTTTDEK